MLRRLMRLLARRPPPPPRRPLDPRLEQDPWLARLFALLGDRYMLGADEPANGTRVLRRTARARFNPMPVWLAGHLVRGDVEVRGAGDREAVLSQARALLDQRVAAPGLTQKSESVEDWAGTVLTRRYEGAFDDAAQAAAAVKSLCEGEQQFNLAAE